MRFNISGEVNIVEPPIMRYIDTEIQKAFIMHYAAKTTPGRLVVVEPGAVLIRITDDEIPVSARIEPRASLCIKNDYDCLIAIAFYICRYNDRCNSRRNWRCGMGQRRNKEN